MAARLTKMRFDEVSFVGRGANQHADVVLFKMQDDDIEKACDHKAMGAKDAKCPTCGAKNEPHMAAGGGNQKGKPVLGEDGKPVSKFARFLKGGKGATKVKDEVVDDEGTDDTEDDDDEEFADADTYVRPVKKGVPGSQSDDGDDSEEKPMLKSELPEAIAKHVEGDDDIEVTAEVLDAAFAKAIEDEITDDEPEVEADPLAKAMEENPIVREAIEKAQAEATAALEIAKAERDRRLSDEFIAKAAEFRYLPTEPEKIGPVLKRLYEASPEDYETVHTLLKSANASSESLFKSAGVDAPSSMEGSSLSAIEKAAANIRTANPDLTPEQAYDRALIENPSLYTESLEG